MNIKKELVATFKNLLGVYFGKVYSDSELKISDKSVGGKVEQINSDGTLTPVEDGDYVMQDGFSFTVKGGVIDSIVGQEKPVEQAVENDTSKEVETPEEEATETPEQEAEDETKVDERLTALEQTVEEIKTMLDSMKMEKMESIKSIESFSSIVKELNENIQTLAKVPVEFSKVNKTVNVEESKEEKLFQMASMIGNIYKK